MTMTKLKFIDLFAGIGGFHSALSKLGHECVFASELSEELQALYKENHGIECHGDITKINVKEIPKHDILCAGFPCQSFSKAGNQKGMKEARGKLFDEILKILKYHKPRYILLENVRNLLTHDNGKTWDYIKKQLEQLNYHIDKKILSPHFIDIPQHRERLFIIGSRYKNDIKTVTWVEKAPLKTSVESIINNNIIDADLEPDKQNVLDVWLDFMRDLPKGISPYRPLWSMEFGATYPLDRNWEEMSLKDWQSYKGNYGYDLSQCETLDEVYTHLPNYVTRQKGIPPNWKQRYIRNNRCFYSDYKPHIKDNVLDLIKNFERESWKKFEWNCPEGERSYHDKLIQFRGSGVRIKHNKYVPSLVTVKTQIPILGKFKRYLLPEEGAKLQSLPDNIMLPETRTSSFRVLGNMVNVELVYRIASLYIPRV